MPFLFRSSIKESQMRSSPPKSSLPTTKLLGQLLNIRVVEPGELSTSLAFLRACTSD